MPQIFRIAGYLIYFWSNENEPLEPIHVHITNGVPTANATKVWITQSGKCLLCHNNSKGRLQVQIEQDLSSNYISGIHLIKKSVEQFIRSVVA